MQLIESFKQFLLSQRNPASAVTVKNYIADIRKFVLWFEEHFSKTFAPQEVTLRTIDLFRASISQAEGSVKSIERYQSSLRKFFRFLKLEGIIATDPFETAEATQAPEDPLHLKLFKNFLYVYNASGLTMKNYLIDIKQFFSWAQQVMPDVADLAGVLEKITPEVIEEYKQRLLSEHTYSPSSINRKLSSLRKYFAWAIEQGIVTRNPFEVETHRVATTSVNIEAILAENIEGKILEKQSSQPLHVKRVYSAIPPLRLMQKILSGLDFLLEKILITPVARVIRSISSIASQAQGKHIFTKPSITTAPQTGERIARGVGNLPKSLYAPIKRELIDYPWYKQIIFHLRFTRPNWYKRYHSYAIAHYFNIAVLLIFCVMIGAGMYSAFIGGGQKSPTLAAAPASPLRILSFQGRLTDNNDNPITSTKSLRFTIYNDAASSGSARLWEETQTVTPDQDGIFSVLLGSNGSGGNAALCNGGNPPTSPPNGPCGIPQSLFAQNAQLWLGVAVENGSELTPRQQLATVAYASNAETLQGLPPITDSSWVSANSNANAVLALGSDGVVNIAGSSNAVTVIQASSSNIKISGNVTTLTTNVGSNGNIELIPDGKGLIDAQKPLFNSTLNNNIRSGTDNSPTAAGAVEVDDLFGVLATSSGQSAVTINQDGVGPIISASHSGLPVFTVDAFGNTTIGGSTTIGGNISLSGFGNLGGVVYQTNSSGQLGVSNPGALGQCLMSGGTGSPIWASCSNGTNWITESAGALYPINTTVDLLIGGSSTQSAIFAVTGSSPLDATSYPTASVSATTGNFAGNGIILGANGSIQSLQNNNLTIGGSTTGNIALTPLNGNGMVTVNGTLIAPNIQATNIYLPVAGGVGGFFQLGSNVIAPSNTINDIAVGGNSTASAKFQVFGATGNATTSGTFTFNTAGNLQTTNFQNLTIGGATTGNITLSPLNGGAGSNLVINAQTITIPNGNTITGVTNFAQFNGGVSVGGNTTYNINANTSNLNSLQINGNLYMPVTGGTAGFWQLSNNIIAPSNLASDLAIGGNATSSAKFQVFGATGNATTSGTFTFNTAGNLQTTNMQNLTIGGSNTGHIILSGLNGANNGISFQGYSAGIIHSDANGVLTSAAVNLASTDVTGILPLSNGGTNNNLTPSNGGIVYSDSSKLQILPGTATSGQCLVSGTNNAPSWQLCASGASGTNYWTNASGAIFPINSTYDLFVGGVSTASAKFAVLNMNSGLPVASVSAQDGSDRALVLSGDGSIQAVQSKNLTIGGITTGNIVLSPFNGTGTVTFAGYSTGIIHSTNGVLSSSPVGLASSDVSGILGVSNGGTGQSFYTAGDMLYYNTGNSLSKLGIGGTNAILTSNGSAPQWSTAITVTGLTVNGSTTLGQSTSDTVTVNGSITGTGNKIIPVGNGVLDLGDSTHYFNTIYANSITTPAGNGTSGFWTVTNNTNLYPSNVADDLLIGGNATNAASFQIFSSAFNNGTSILAGTASTSGSLSFRGSGTQVNLLDGTGLTIKASAGGDSGLTSLLALNSNGNITLAGSSIADTASSLTLFNSSTNIDLGAAATTFSLGANNSGYTEIRNEFRADQNYRLTGNLLTSIIPNVSSLNLGRATNPFGTLFANNVSVPINSYDGYWQMNNQVLSPQYNVSDLAIGGTATGSAAFQVFGSSFNPGGNFTVGAGTATTSARLTFNGLNTTPGVNLLNNSIFALRTSVGGDAGLGVGGGHTLENNLAIASVQAFPTEGNLNESLWSSYLLTDIGSNRTLRLGVVNDGNTKGEIEINNGNRWDGYIAFKTVNQSPTQPTGALERMRIAGTGEVLIGATSTNVANTGLDIEKNSLGNSALVINQVGAGDIFTASSSGIPQFTIANDGSIKNSLIPNLNNAYNLGSDPNLGGKEWDTLYVRQIIGPGGTTSFTNYWQLSNNGVLAPANVTNDLAVGGNSTASAVFQVFAKSFATDAGTVPAGTATTSGNLVFTGTPGSQTGFKVNLLNDSSLGFYNSTGGNIGINTSNPALYIANNGNVGLQTNTPNGVLDVFQGTATSRFSRNTSQYIQVNTDASFNGFLGVSQNGNPKPFVFASDTNSSGISFRTNTPDGTTNTRLLIDNYAHASFGTTTVGNAALVVNQVGLTGAGDLFVASRSGTSKFVINNDGGVGIGNGVNSSNMMQNTALYINKDSGSTPLLFLNQLSVAGNPGDLINASNSGTTEFRVDAGGTIYAGKFVDLANVNGTYYLDPANAGTSLIINGNAGIGNTNPNAKLELAMTTPLTLTNGNTADLISADDINGTSSYTPIWRVTAQGGIEQMGNFNSPFGGIGVYENLLIQSEGAFSGSAYTGYFQKPTTTDNTTDVQAPDGSYTATKAVIGASFPSGTADGFIQNTSTGPTPGTPWTVSIWLRGLNGGEAVQIGANDSNMTSTFTLTKTWKRYNFSTNSLANPGSNYRGFQIKLLSLSSTYYMWGAQAERRNYPGTYIATTTNAVIPSPAGNNAGFVMNATGSAIFQGSVNVGTTSGQAIFEGYGGTNYDPSLTYGAPAGYIFNTAGEELATGVLTASPWSYWMQTRAWSNNATNLALNPLGGNVGIGTTSPSQKLEVNGSVLVDNSNKYYFNSTNSYLGLGLNSDPTLAMASNTNWLRLTGAAGLAMWGDGGGTSNNNPNMFISTSGKVGINTTTPTDMLDINGLGSYAQLRLINGSTALMLRNDGSSTYFLWGTSATGGWSANRPITLPDNSDNVYLSQAGGHVTIAGANANGRLNIYDPGGDRNNAEWGDNGFMIQSATGGNYLTMYGGSMNYGGYIQTAQAGVGTSGTYLLLNYRGGKVQGGSNCFNLSGGATAVFCSDYAEYYNAKTIMDPADIVSPDTSTDSAHFVEKTTKAYDPAAIGVVSTTPAVIIDDGAFIMGNGNQPIEPTTKPPVASAGRVPVKFVSANGMVHVGDAITSAGYAGFGMKATKAGPIVGKVIEDFDPANGEMGRGVMPCPADAPSGAVCGKVMVLLNISWYDPDVFITDTGAYNIATDSAVATPSADFTVPHYFDITDATGQTVTRMGAYLELAVSNLKAGGVSAQEVATNTLAVLTDNVSIAGQSLHDYVASIVREIVGNNTATSPLAKNGTVQADVLSPLSQDSSISATLTNNKFAIHAGTASDSATVAAIDNSGNATLSGSLTSSGLAVNGDATVSGTLHADKIEANSIVGLSAILSTLSAQNVTNVTNIIFATPSSTAQNGIDTTSQNSTSSGQNQVLNASGSGQLTNGYIDVAQFGPLLSYVPQLHAATAQFDQGLMSLGPTSLSDTSITGTLSIGSQMVLADNTLNVLGSDLEIQPLKQGGVDFLAGAVKIDSNGDMTINGKAIFNNTLYAKVLSPLAGQDFTVQLGDQSNPNSNFVVKNASGSSVFAVSQVGDIIASGAATVSKLNLNPIPTAQALSQTEIVATSSAGTAVVNAYQKEITIDTPYVTDKSLIYITPVGNDSNQTPYLLRQVPGKSFTVGVNVPTSVDTKFNWLIIN